MKACGERTSFGAVSTSRRFWIVHRSQQPDQVNTVILHQYLASYHPIIARQLQKHPRTTHKPRKSLSTKTRSRKVLFSPIYRISSTQRQVSQRMRQRHLISPTLHLEHDFHRRWHQPEHSSVLQKGQIIEPAILNPVAVLLIVRCEGRAPSVRDTIAAECPCELTENLIFCSGANGYK